MTRATNKLSARFVQTTKEPGWHGDGNGLYLRVGADRRSWVFIYQRAGKRAEKGFGSPPDVSLAEAREKAASARERVRRGEALDDTPLPGVEAPKTFGIYADECIDEWVTGFRNPKHKQQWRNTIATYCQSIAAKPLAEVSTEDVLAILRPIWLTKNETASRLRGRIERILNAARATNLIGPPYENPARWKGHLEVLLPKYDQNKRGHFAAIPYEEAPAFMARLRERSGVADRALEFTILTAVRSHMTRGMLWEEVTDDLWVIPGEKMKLGKEHTVPLTPRMKALMGERATGPVFLGQRGGELSDGALERPLDKLGVAVTVHGMRSTFKDWAANMTDFPDEVSEEVLAHAIGSKTTRAYRRGEAIAKRLALLEAWDAYLGGGRPTA